MVVKHFSRLLQLPHMTSFDRAATLSVALSRFIVKALRRFVNMYGLWQTVEYNFPVLGKFI